MDLSHRYLFCKSANYFFVIDTYALSTKVCEAGIPKLRQKGLKERPLRPDPLAKCLVNSAHPLSY